MSGVNACSPHLIAMMLFLHCLNFCQMFHTHVFSVKYCDVCQCFFIGLCKASSAGCDVQNYKLLTVNSLFICELYL